MNQTPIEKLAVLKNQKDQNIKEAKDLHREMDDNREEFEDITGIVDKIEDERFESMSEDKQIENDAKFDANEDLYDALSKEEDQLDWDKPETKVRQVEILREEVRIASEYSKYHKNMNDECSPIRGTDLRQDYDSLVEEREQASIKTLGSMDSMITKLKEGLEIESQIKSLEDAINSGPQADNDGSSGDSNGPQAGNNAGSLLDDYADPSLEQPSHMDPED